MHCAKTNIKSNIMKNKFSVTLFACMFATKVIAYDTGNLSCREYQDYILTHELTPFGPIPTALDPSGVHPYVSYCETSKRPVLKKYHFIVLKNDWIRIKICPDLGGKVVSMILVRSGKEVLYVPEVILTQEYCRGFIL